MTEKRRSGRRKKEESADTKQSLLDAATAEFAANGFNGARVGEISERAGVNKQLVYHYFGSKDDLYVAVLENAYRRLRESETRLDLSGLPPPEAMRKVVEFSFDHLEEHREFVSLLADENIHRGQRMGLTDRMEAVNRPIIDLIQKTLERGERSGDFRKGLDPLQVYLSIASLGFFYFSNMHTLSRIFSRDLGSEDAIQERRRHVVDFAITALLNPDGPSAAA